MADENGTPSDPRTISDMEFIYVAGAVRLGARPTVARDEFRAGIVEVERAAAARALEEAASSPIPREALTNGTRTWLRARAAEMREGAALAPVTEEGDGE